VGKKWKGSPKEDDTPKGEADATPNDGMEAITDEGACDAAGSAILGLSITTGAGLGGTTMVMVADCSPQKN
jgi:hypothetical protein